MRYFKFDYWFDDSSYYWEVISEVELAKRMAFLKEFRDVIDDDTDPETWIEIRNLLEGECDPGWEDTYVDYTDFLKMYTKLPALKDITEEEYEAVKRVVGTNVFGGAFFYAYVNFLEAIIEDIENSNQEDEENENNLFLDLEKAHQLVTDVKAAVKIVEDFGD